MPSKQAKLIVAAITLIVIAILISSSGRDQFLLVRTSVEIATAEPTVLPPNSIPIPDSPLKESIIAAGEYMVRQQLTNGELSYQVDFQSGAREFPGRTYTAP